MVVEIANSRVVRTDAKLAHNRLRIQICQCDVQLFVAVKDGLRNGESDPAKFLFSELYFLYEQVLQMSLWVIVSHEVEVVALVVVEDAPLLANCILSKLLDRLDFIKFSCISKRLVEQLVYFFPGHLEFRLVIELVRLRMVVLVVANY